MSNNEEPRILAYRYIIKFETELHQFIRRMLEEEYGYDEKEWWVKGIPYQIRVDCSKKREEDEKFREEPYKYTDLIDLRTIIDKNWRLFEPEFQLVKGKLLSKKELLEAVIRSNEIRRRVMHPTRSIVTNDEIYFLKDFHDVIEEVTNKRLLQLTNWDIELAEIQEATKLKPSELIDTFSWFYENGLIDLIMSKSPIISKSRLLELVFLSIELREAELDEEFALLFNLTYTCPLYLRARLLVKETAEIKEQDLYFGDIPLITQNGTFIINGIRKNYNIKPITNHSLKDTPLNTALDVIKDKAIKRMNKVSLETVTPSGLIDTGYFVNAVKEFFAVIT